MDPEQEPMGFGDDLDDAIAYASDAVEAGVAAEVWMTGSRESPGHGERVWPETG